MSTLEHVNITVPDIDEAIKFLKTVALDFQVRIDKKPPESIRWAHIGNNDYYFALQEPHLDSVAEEPKQTYKNYGVNHIGIVVEDLSVVEDRLVEAGYKRGISTPIEKYRKRLYFYDSFGFEWELIEYLSGKPSEKYLYEELV
ncbi:VOC family protein [Acaryochloris sp. IP29b_bin.137]|uniref:VOC family protein n=1 Tax=Acaryochloris sp. IP29b_bin.137 TaxID=2969217 RepID=UPI00260720B3|nr:VOC family protein [Acaryochloris sp. IP29b_bin.137]